MIPFQTSNSNIRPAVRSDILSRDISPIVIFLPPQSKAARKSYGKLNLKLLNYVSEEVTS